jgi:hypothetical protein
MSELTGQGSVDCLLVLLGRVLMFQCVLVVAVVYRILSSSCFWCIERQLV